MSARKDGDLNGAGAAESIGRIEGAVDAARRFLLSLQREDGHWCGELEGDTILESEYILTLYFLGRGGERRTRKAGEYLRRKQMEEGGWSIYPGGPAEVSASVKAYFALKLLGDDPDAPHMARARSVIRALGGIDACNSFTRIYLSIFGQYDWSRCPAVPPELVLLPDWFPFNIYRMSSWSRAIVVPLSIIWAARPRCEIPEGAAIGELAVEHAAPPRRKRAARLRDRLWIGFFRGVDRGLHLAEGLGFRPLRRRALSRAEAWIHEHLEQSDGLGAIFPPIINTIIAFRCLGYALDDPRLLRQTHELEKLEIEEEDALRVQPCFSPVWDTALALQAAREAGLAADDDRVLRAAEWLLDREVRRPGDWTRGNPDGRPGGWVFEYRNEFYPDVDDTAEVLIALSRVRFPDEVRSRRLAEAVRRGVQWQLSMQNRDGGWAAFDKGCDNEVLTLIPFADHNAMIDPSCEDITGRTLVALARHGYAQDHPAVRAAAAYLERRQDPSGTWYGRWGCNYIYGTWLALRGLAQAGEDLSAEPYRRAVEWLCRRQNPDGGWGELPLSYDEPDKKGVGPSTPSQTAWALLALFAAGDFSSDAVWRGLEFLLRTQQYDGSWTDEHWTGTGFPKVFYLRYHLYASYFPLFALARYRRALEARSAGSAQARPLAAAATGSGDEVSA
jgi:squalene-hopene/tetraprenyl-beta-curcumene cyclase